jgi:hypothetical protein
VNPKKILSDSEFDSDNEMNDCALLDVVVNDNSNNNDNIIRNFVWEGVKNYKR